MIEQCNGCIYQRTEEQASKAFAPSLCGVYLYPEEQHSRIGGCAMRPKEIVTTKEKFVDPLKASKAASKALSKSKRGG